MIAESTEMRKHSSKILAKSTEMRKQLGILRKHLSKMLTKSTKMRKQTGILLIQQVALRIPQLQLQLVGGGSCSTTH